jgi:hypothetical protein
MAGFRRPHNKRLNADKATGEVVFGGGVITEL